MIEIEIPLEYRAYVTQLYEQARCQRKMDSGFSKYLFNNVGIKRWCHIFCLCIDKLEETKNSSMKEEKKKDWMVGNSYMSLICTPIC